MHRVMDAADRAEARADKKDARPSRGRLSSMDLVPEDGQEDIVWAVGELNKGARTQRDILFELNDRLAAKDIEPISPSAFNRKSTKLAAMSNRLNEARHIFSGLAPQFTPEKVDDNNVVLGEVIKLLIFELVQDPGSVDTKGAQELARAYLAAIQGQKLSGERRTAIEERFKRQAAVAIDTVAKARGLSKDVAEDMRASLFGIPKEARGGA